MDKYQDLQKPLDRVIANLYKDRNMMFLASLYCAVDFIWDDQIPTACTDGLTIRFNPSLFKSLSEPERLFILVHELEHVGRMHMVRRGTRDPSKWNIACDLRINHDIISERGLPMPTSAPGLLDKDLSADLAEEEIYDLLPDDGSYEDPEDLSHGEPSESDKRKVVEAVSRAAKIAESAGGVGVSGNLAQWIKEYLTPQVPWQELLKRWFSDMSKKGYTYRRPNRRYAHTSLILPSLAKCSPSLRKIQSYGDSSGSITLGQLEVIFSELRHIKKTFSPQEMRLIQFDTEITDDLKISNMNDFNKFKVIGGGGTNLECVRDHIIKTDPSGVIILSDLHCNPMEPLPKPIPIIWVCLDNPKATVPFGTIIHVKTTK